MITIPKKELTLLLALLAWTLTISIYSLVEFEIEVFTLFNCKVISLVIVIAELVIVSAILVDTLYAIFLISFENGLRSKPLREAKISVSQWFLSNN